jgi:hypothetical protein
MVLGEPVPGVAEALGRLREVDAVPQRFGGRLARADRHEVQNGEGGGGHVVSVTLASR